jgi:cytochrome bd-type quinol oxidase subunit 1
MLTIKAAAQEMHDWTVDITCAAACTLQSTQMPALVLAVHARMCTLMFFLFIRTSLTAVLLCCAAAAAVCTLQSTLMPASTLTMVSIITCMKLTTYAHCNTTLRCQARKKAATDAAAASDKAAVAAALADAPAATTDTPFASISASGLASELQNHNPQNPKNGSESGSASGFTVYPQNLNLADVAYYMLAPTLTYQLNFPRMKRRRVRLLRRWMLLLLGALLLMSFMQVSRNWCFMLVQARCVAGKHLVCSLLLYTLPNRSLVPCVCDLLQHGVCITDK